MEINKIIPDYECFKKLKTEEKIAYTEGVILSIEESLQEHKKELKESQNDLEIYTNKDLITERIKRYKKTIKEEEKRLEILKIAVELFKE